MSSYILSFKPAIGLYGQHDPSAALFEDGNLIYAVEEERLSRQKHAINTFPRRAIRACLDYRDLDLDDIDRVILPYRPTLSNKILRHYVQNALSVDGMASKIGTLEEVLKTRFRSTFRPTAEVESRLAELGSSVPPVETRSHHACHAASAFHPSGFDEALVLTIDAKGEYDSTVIWNAHPDGLDRIRTYEHPNSLGLFFAVITKYLGYRMFNGEGKVMGLAPYGEENEAIESTLREVIDTGVDYDVTDLTQQWGTGYGVATLEELFDRPAVETPGEFSQWEKDLAYTAQKLLEETVVDITETYAPQIGAGNVGLAGGVVLNCKMNTRVMQADGVEDVFVQPVANDAGLALGAGWITQHPDSVPQMTDVYLGPSFDSAEVRDLLETNKIPFAEPDDLEAYVADRLAEGDLVGWFHGRLELGPRALGNRSILADPRSVESRDRVNRFVKHREEWRPFAPSMLASTVDDYLDPSHEAPFMITTASVPEDQRDDLTAVLHPSDQTTRPQTVRREQNPRYHRLISEFYDRTGVPAVLNTSFNDHGEPIVTTPTEALKDFFGMGLDLLAIEDIVVTKPSHEDSPTRMEETLNKITL
ncbi:carbamoyltransferase family protein [Halomicrococcus sp. NG-SE-24]|uniref:carbamoyltransferase family protein n=1 Tax=Halomicrococcus sp. NG-SE-24 TaxID=3436928 RepID=UPI003D9809C5